MAEAIFKKKKVLEYYKRLSVDGLFKKFSESNYFRQANESSKEKINSEIKILSEYDIKGINPPFDVYDMMNYYRYRGLIGVEGNILKNDDLIIMVKFEKKFRNLPDVAYAIYNGEEINFGSVKFIPDKFEKDLEGKVLNGIEMDLKGNVLKGKLRREDNKNMISLPEKYILKEQIFKLPREGHLLREDVSGWCIRYAKCMIRQKIY